VSCRARSGRKLKKTAGLVARLDRGHSVHGRGSRAVHDRTQRAVGAVPALVAVHRVVAPADGDDGDARADELGDVAAGRVRRDVAPVREGVHEGALGHSFAPGELDQRAEVIDVAVHAAVGHEPEKVDVRPALLRPLECIPERLVLEEVAALDRAVDSHEVLVDHPAGADREMADLGVPHLPARQADRFPGGFERRVRVAAPELVEDGCVRELDSVPRPRRRAAPAVEDDERYERIRAADWQIAVKESTSREAPPTSAPSTAGSDRISSAFSGLTEPP
jgi:hypothetical protein